MDDQEYIREAVELADGWELDDYWLWFPDEGYRWNTDFPFPMWILAAIAAQLVEQVDANSEWFLTSDDDVTGIYPNWCDPDTGDAPDCCRTEGPDRTMNTIKVIVDSKVLGSAK